MSEPYNQTDDEISLKEYIEVISKRKWLILLVIVFAVLAIFMVNTFTTPIYKASTTVLISQGNPTRNIIGDNGEMDLIFGAGDEIETQVEIIKSRSIAEGVARKLPTDAFEKAAEENFEKTKDEFRGLINLLGLFHLKPLAAKLVGAAEIENPDEENQLTFDNKVKRIMKYISVNVVKNTKVISISSETNNPQLAATIANLAAEEFVEQSQRFNRSEASEGKKFIQEQLLKKEQELESLEKQKLDFKRQENILYLDEETKLNIEQLSEFQSQKLELDTQLAESDSKLKELKRQLDEQAKTVISSRTITANPVVQQLQNQLSNLEVQLAGMKEKYSQNSPLVTDMEIQIRQIKNEINQKVAEIVGSKVSSVNPIYQSLLSQQVTLESNLIAMETKRKILTGVIAQYEAKLEKLPEKEMQLARLERSVRAAENIYLTLLDSYQQARISEAMELGDIKIIDQALIPKNPIKPRKTLNFAIGGVLGLMLGVMLVFFLEFLDNTFKSKEDIEKYLELPVLGTIPFVNEFEAKKRKRKKKQ